MEDGQGKLGGEGAQRSGSEREAQERVRRLFEESPTPTLQKLAAFPKWVRRADLTGFLARYELFRRVLDVKGSVVEGGVFQGGGLFTWAKLSAILEPNNITRRIYGFDTFEGFPSVGDEDRSGHRATEAGELRADVHEELEALVAAYDMDRFLGHVPKVRLVRGDASETIPAFVDENRHLLVSLLFLDFDLYEPTVAALRHFLPRMPKGAIVAFDELDNPAWPGETQALLDQVGAGALRLRRFEFDPYVAWAVID